MTNKEKFIEIMNQTFDAGYTEDNFDIRFDCAPTYAYKEKCSLDIGCSDCRRWWDEEYKELDNNA